MFHSYVLIFCQVPEIELKGESCRYYFLLQGNGSGGCKATLIHSAGQINGMATLAAVNGKLKAKAEETESGKSDHLFFNEYLNAGKW